ncbi:hypothetical protein ACFCYI_22395 [Streptomyces sp. NPDC056257]|uniref:hypothetical protein n=1 Tax=unclassified Streptomyces TaxID=2593676 RepID=UPI0035DB4C4C
MTHHTAARAAATAALTIAVALACAPAAQAAERPGGGTGALAGPLSLDNLLSLRFLAPTVQDAKQQILGLASGLSPAKTDEAGLGRLLK